MQIHVLVAGCWSTVATTDHVESHGRSTLNAQSLNVYVTELRYDLADLANLFVNTELLHAEVRIPRTRE